MQVLRFVVPSITLALATLGGCGSDDEGGGIRNPSFGGSAGASGSAGQGGSPDGGGGSSATGGSAGAAGAAGSSGSAGSAGAGGKDPNIPGKVCFLTSCKGDADCVDCSGNRTTCDTGSSRCVACIPGDPTLCPSGKDCSVAGTCIDPGQTCPSSCTSDGDCAPCAADKQVCDTTLGQCVTCTQLDLSACKGNQFCDAATGDCKDKCPAACTSDADCAQCSNDKTSAPACNVATGKCGQCSATTACPSGEVCSPQGVCIKTCGVPDRPRGTCTDDAECAGCGADSLACHTPINGGDGKCGIPAAGCSDLGSGNVVLPDPWSSITNTCSDDTDCTGVGLNFNVGKELRDLTGLGFVNDATVQYGMNSCAAVEVGLPGFDPVSCGICVPCKTDADCDPIQIDPLVDQMFDGVSELAARWALDKLYGDNPHVLNFYCQGVAGDYGVCVPCLDPSSECGLSGGTVGSGCTNVFECGGGEFCNNGMCEAVPQSCFVGGGECTGGEVCAWNGDDYCCRPSGQGTQSCTSDGECSGGDVCAWNGTGFFCVAPITCS